MENNIPDCEVDLLDFVHDPSHEEGEAFVDEVYDDDKEKPMIIPPEPVLTPVETILWHREQLRSCWRHHGFTMNDTEMDVSRRILVLDTSISETSNSERREYIGASERLAALLEPLLPQPILPSMQTLVDLNEYLIGQLEELVVQRDGDRDYEPDDAVKKPDSEFYTGAYEDRAYEEGYYCYDAGYMTGPYGDCDYEEGTVNSDDDYFVADDNTVWCCHVFAKKGKGHLRMRKGKLTAVRACKIAAKITRVGAYGTNKGITSISFGTYGPNGVQH